MARSAWRLPGYRVDELLGAGSSGEVWRAYSAATGSAVALKRIWVAGPSQRQGALAEAAVLSALDHPHLVKVHELHHCDEAIVLVLDLAAGGSLAALLARRGRLTVGEAITAIAPIGAALAYAHHHGVVHGDVSTANVLFTEVGLPLLGDLGVARLLGGTAPVRTTPAYADPAVAAGALPGPASDVFMLGAIALHALTGAPPWPGHGPAEVLTAAASGAQPDFAARLAAAGVPFATADVVARALRVDPALRGTAADFALDLRHSGTPVAVELFAGRQRVAPTLRATIGATADFVESWPLESVPLHDSAAVDDAVPFDDAALPFIGEQPRTDAAAAGWSGGSTSSARHLARGRPRVATGFAVCAVLLAMITAASIWWWPFGGGHHRTTSIAGVSAVGRVVPTPLRPAASRPAATTRAPTTAVRALDAAGARAVLAGLDATRSAAFATRDPGKLAAVYASATLLARDRAMLTSIVPSGCGLHGVRTSFSRIVVTTHSADRVRLRSNVLLASSTLVCGGTTTGRAAGSPTEVVSIDLVRQGTSYRIAGQHRVDSELP